LRNLEGFWGCILWKFFNSSQKRLDEIKRQQEKQRRKIEREVCALVSSGNISLQRGEYITQEDMDKLHDKLLKFFESDESKW